MPSHLIHEIQLVGHVNMFCYENGRQVPVEIGLCQVLPEGVPESRRRTLLLGIDNSNLTMSKGDRSINYIVSRKITKLPVSFRGKVNLREAERRIRHLAGGRLVAAKGPEQKMFFEKLGVRAVDIKSEVVPHCPKFEELQPNVLIARHADHFDDRWCSLNKAVAFAKFIEKEKNAMLMEPEEYWDDVAFVVPLPRDAAAVASPLPRDAAAVASPLPRDTATIASPLPRDGATIASPLPRDAAAIASPLPRDAATIASPLPRDAATIASPLPRDGAAVSCAGSGEDPLPRHECFSFCNGREIHIHVHVDKRDFF